MIAVDRDVGPPRFWRLEPTCAAAIAERPRLDIRTPRWLGYLIQRPESHCVHHQRGWHRNNYSDLPLWDILFGTFENPDASRYSCGFGVDAEQHVGTMLMGRLAGRPAIFREQR